ncbi:MAG TPA: ABC transporter permease [Gemmatimonadales bacterium]|jgi:peptide/nickel transport system permease protein
MAATLRRLALALATVLLVLTVTFAGVHLAPGDPVALYLGPNADAASAGVMRHDRGLDRPLPVQYAQWLGRFVSGDWGTSIAQHRAVTRVLGDALWPTLILSSVSLLLSYLIGIAIGAWQAVQRRTTWDWSLTALTIFVQAIPAYVLALGLVLVFAYGAALWHWPAPLRLPAMGAASIGADLLSPPQRLGDALRHLILPVITLSAIGAAGLARYVRASTIEALRQPAVRTARAKGLAEMRVLSRHALRNALVPVITLAGLQLPALFSGVVFVEVIFAWPGMGRVMVTAVLGRDYPVIMAATAVFAGLVVIGNLIADACVAMADPRVR